MKEKIKRTNKTELSDDELIIFDVLFDCNAPVNALKKGEEFSWHFNYPSHDLDEGELKDTIERFVSNGLMRLKLTVFPKNNQIVSFVGLTEKGGKLWEKERLPIWEKYVFDSSSDCKGFWELSIFSLTLEAARDFLVIAQECKLYELMDPNDLKISELKGKDAEDLIPWKIFDKLYEIKSRLSERIGTENSPETDWEHYQLKSMWWRDVEELQMLQNKISI